MTSTPVCVCLCAQQASEILEKKDSTAQEENTLRRIMMYSYYVLQDNYVQILIAWYVCDDMEGRCISDSCVQGVLALPRGFLLCC